MLFFPQKTQKNLQRKETLLWLAILHIFCDSSMNILAPIPIANIRNSKFMPFSLFFHPIKHYLTSLTMRRNRRHKSWQEKKKKIAIVIIVSPLHFYSRLIHCAREEKKNSFPERALLDCETHYSFSVWRLVFREGSIASYNVISVAWAPENF